VTPEELTSADREIAQLALLRIWLGRQKRAMWEITQGATKVIVKRYDVHGKRILSRKR
jgi:hypothetical protein